jgi:hypothetical protein
MGFDLNIMKVKCIFIPCSKPVVLSVRFEVFAKWKIHVSVFLVIVRCKLVEVITLKKYVTSYKRNQTSAVVNNCTNILISRSAPVITVDISEALSGGLTFPSVK